ncbi:UNVERIFIED_CONTAM: hypothetical protein FKN15_045341 [Acipenser sinensis]
MSTEEILHCNLSKSFENSSTEAETPSVKQLEDIMYSGQSSCRHVDEVWPNIYLGDIYMAHDRYGLWKMGITHVLNAAHRKMCCKGSQDFYGTTVDYHGVPANDLPDFDLSQYFYSSADYIHKAINSPGGKNLFFLSVLSMICIPAIKLLSISRKCIIRTVVWQWLVDNILLDFL